jgi:hypothetical protein
MPDWSIKIVAGATPGAPATFVVDRDDVPPGNPLVAGPRDLVSWNNTSGAAHQPWPADADYKPLPDPLPKSENNVSRTSPYYLSDNIPPDASSRPSWLVSKSPAGDGTKMYYCCLLHPAEHGQIIIRS